MDKHLVLFVSFVGHVFQAPISSYSELQPFVSEPDTHTIKNVKSSDIPIFIIIDVRFLSGMHILYFSG